MLRVWANIFLQREGTLVKSPEKPLDPKKREERRVGSSCCVMKEPEVGSKVSGEATWKIAVL